MFIYTTVCSRVMVVVVGAKEAVCHWPQKCESPKLICGTFITITVIVSKATKFIFCPGRLTTAVDRHSWFYLLYICSACVSRSVQCVSSRFTVAQFDHPTCDCHGDILCLCILRNCFAVKLDCSGSYVSSLVRV